MFCNKYNHSVDDKGRLIIPTEYRPELVGNDMTQSHNFYITTNLWDPKGRKEPCLCLWPEENFGELKNILQMTTTECWQFPNAQSYVSDGFYLEWRGETFSMKNEGNQAVALYGIHIGDEAGASGKAMTDHGWTEYQYGGYIMQTDKAQYYMELESDENGKVTSWYLNNWPEGDITEAYDSLEKQ